MKKTSSIILIMAMLVTSLLSLFAVGVNAATDPGVVVYQNSDYTWVASYYYESDDIAIANGAIAKFTNVSDGRTNYLKEWRAIGAFGNVASYGCGDTITLISDSTKKISVPSGISFDAGSRTFTVYGNGITFEGAGRVDVAGGDAGCVTLKNLTVNNTSANTSAMQFGSDSKGPKVILDNVKLSAKAPNYSTLVNKSSDVVIQNGTQITNNGTPAKDSVRCYGIYMMGTLPSLEMIDGAITTTGPAIYQNNAGKLIINGGSLTTTTSCCTYATIYSTTSTYEKSIMNATVTAPAGEKAIHLANGNINVDGRGIRNCTINGGVYIYGGTKVTNCTITAKGNAVAYEQGATLVNFYDSTIISENGIALKLDKHDTYSTSAHLYNTNVKSTGAEAISGADNSNCYVYSGSFMGAGDVAAVYVNQASGKDGSVMSFKGNLDAVVDTADLLKGASVRTAADSSGIRFQSTITKDAVAALENIYGVGSLTFGTLIAPYDYLESTGGVFTKEALAAKELKCIQLDADKGLHDMGDYYLINAAMIDVKTANYNREFVAVPYVTITTANGTVTVYGTYDAEDNVRSIREVAYAALSDVLYVGQTIEVEGQSVTVDEAYIASKTTYANKVTSWYEFNGTSWEEKTGEAYTEYSTAQRNVMDDYIA